MLTCITCSKQRMEDGDEDNPRGTPSTKDAVKNLTSQLKDIALKVSSGQKGRPGGADSRFRTGPRSYPDFDAISEGGSYPYVQPGSSSSTPVWDHRSTGGHRPPGPPDSRYTAFGSDKPPHGPESISCQPNDVLLEGEDEAKEWMAQVEPGVQITFVSLPRGGNDLKRIRFSREMFNKWQAQRWWGENYDRIMELYNVQRFNQQALNTPGRSEDGRDSNYSRIGSALESPRMTTPSLNKEWTPRYRFPQQDPYQGGSSAYSPYPTCATKGEMPSMEASRTTTSSRNETSVSISNASEVESEWIEEDEPGVYITIRQLNDGTRELRRVRFSRERFGEVHAKLWWETNRDRIQSQYLC